MNSNQLSVASLAQLVEHFTCNEGVIGSNPIGGSRRDSKAVIDDGVKMMKKGLE